MAEVSEKQKLTDLRLALRTPQVDYLDYLSERDSVGLSEALRKVIASAMQRATSEISRPSRKLSRHVCLPQEQIGFIDQLSKSWGVDRSDVTRRLIDEERSMDLTL